MDDDYFKGLSGQATHDSISNTMGILQREQELTRKKQNEAFLRTRVNAPASTTSSPSTKQPVSTHSASPVESIDESNLAERSDQEFSPEQTVGAGLVFIGLALCYFISEYWPWILTGIGVIFLIWVVSVILDDDET